MAIRKTTKGKGRNFRSTKEGAGMTAKGVREYKKKNPGSKLKTAVKVKGVLQLDVDGNVNIMWALFKDKNDINEKNVIGFASFIVMTLFAIADLMTSLIADKDLIINEVVYNSFVWVTLGCFGISAVEKIKK